MSGTDLCYGMDSDSTRMSTFDMVRFSDTVPWSESQYQLEIRSMERGICPIVVFYFALKRSFFNI